MRTLNKGTVHFEFSNDVLSQYHHLHCVSFHNVLNHFALIPLRLGKLQHGYSCSRFPIFRGHLVSPYFAIIRDNRNEPHHNLKLFCWSSPFLTILKFQINYKINLTNLQNKK